MVTDTYAHGFDADRQLIAHEMDTGSFAKVGAASTVEEVDTDMLSKLKALIQPAGVGIRITERDGKKTREQGQGTLKCWQV